MELSDGSARLQIGSRMVQDRFLKRPLRCLPKVLVSPAVPIRHDFGPAAARLENAPGTLGPRMLAESWRILTTRFEIPPLQNNKPEQFHSGLFSSLGAARSRPVSGVLRGLHNKVAQRILCHRAPGLRRRFWGPSPYITRAMLSSSRWKTSSVLPIMPTRLTAWRAASAE